MPVGSGDGVGDCHDVADFLEMWLFISLLVHFGRANSPFYRDAYSVGTPSWAFWEKGWLMECKTTFSLFWMCFLVSKRTLYFFGRVIMLMLHIGRARHPGPGPRSFTPGQLSIEFVNVVGWLTYGDLALDSCAQFLAIAEHRLIPARARSVCHQLRRAGYHSVWAPACQDQVAGGHAGVGVVSLGGAPLSLPSFVTPHFQEGRVLRTTLPSGKGGVVHLLVVYGFQVAEKDGDKLQFTDKLLQAVLAKAQVVCIGQPVLIAGDLNADPPVIPCLAKGISLCGFLILLLLTLWVLVLLLMSPVV